MEKKCNCTDLQFLFYIFQPLQPEMEGGGGGGTYTIKEKLSKFFFPLSGKTGMLSLHVRRYIKHLFNAWDFPHLKGTKKMLKFDTPLSFPGETPSPGSTKC